MYRLVMKATALSAAWLALVPGLASAEVSLRLGEVNSYKAQAVFLEHYKRGLELAVDDINANGGVKGGTVELILRDDNANPGDTIRAAEELFVREDIDILIGGFLSNTALALADYARQKNVVYLAGEPMTDRLTWQGGNKNTFRIRPGTYTQVAMLVPEAAKLQKKRWALVYPNYEFGQSAIAAFKELIAKQQPDVEIVGEFAAPLGKIDAGSVTQAISDVQPDAIFNALFGADLLKFVREGNTRGIFSDRPVVSLLTGEPEYLDPMKRETPEGWIVTGYPYASLNQPEHVKFVEAYRAKFDDYPRLGSLVGYSLVLTATAAFLEAGSSDTDALIAALKKIEVSTPIGPVRFRDQDNQGTMGTYVGTLTQKDGKGVMENAVFYDGAEASLHPSDDVIAAARSE